MKILLAVHGPAQELAAMLERWGFTNEVVNDGRVAMEVMTGPDAPKLLLLDAGIHGVDSLEICRRLHERHASDPPYIIIMTTAEHPGDLVRALDAGASDCIRQPLDWEELRARVSAGQRTLQLRAELNEAKRIMTRLAMRDPLTSLYNRRAILERLEQEQARSRRSQHPVHVGLADLDDFKKINDTYGHQAGDEVLLAFTRGVQQVMRRCDSVGRWGGEEFLIVAPAAPHVKRNPLFERIRRHTSCLAVPVHGETLTLSVSIGVAVSGGLESADALLHRADEALYAAKRNGRNQICYEPWESPMAGAHLPTPFIGDPGAPQTS